jgi:putative transposase
MKSLGRSYSEARASACPDSLDRKHPIHLSPLEAHNRSLIVFVTICTAKRRKVLAAPSPHDAIVAAWRAAQAWLTGRYVIMPDHIHVFCAPNGLDAPSLERWVRYWKSLVTKTLSAKSETIWQRDHWDRQLRSGESYGEKWEYVRNNPVRHGYVSNADDWPYQGELNELRW